MTMATRIFIVLLAACIAALPAKAASTVFGASVFSETGVTDSANALGAADGAAAVIGSGGELVLQYDLPLTGSDLALSVLENVGGVNFVQLSIGEVVGGVATFFGSTAVVDGGAGFTLSADIANMCSVASATGCSLLRIQNLAGIGGGGLFVDSLSAVTNVPEPAAWLLMILGFAGVAARLKAVRNGDGLISAASFA